jgi:soluble lytic murein transglycosylase-like protein
VTPLRQEAPVDQRLLDNSNQMVRIASMRVRDAEMGLQSLRDRGAGAAQIARAEGVLRNAQERLTAAQQGLQRVQTSGPQPAAQPAATPATPATPAAPTAATDALVKAMTQVESSGRPGAVSPSGAVGLMQVRPSTAMNPGYGVPNIFDFLRYEGTRNEAIATEFLKDPQTGAAYGRAYMDAMLREFGGNLDHALAAYNMGRGLRRSGSQKVRILRS